MKKFAFIFLLCMALTACNEQPRHTVVTGKFVVYHAEMKQTGKYGKYEYWVRDGTSKGWTYVSDDVFNVGDELTIIKK